MVSAMVHSSQANERWFSEYQAFPHKFSSPDSQKPWAENGSKQRSAARDISTLRPLLTPGKPAPFACDRRWPLLSDSRSTIKYDASFAPKRSNSSTASRMAPGSLSSEIQMHAEKM